MLYGSNGSHIQILDQFFEPTRLYRVSNENERELFRPSFICTKQNCDLYFVLLGPRFCRLKNRTTRKRAVVYTSLIGIPYIFVTVSTVGQTDLRNISPNGFLIYACGLTMCFV